MRPNGSAATTLAGERGADTTGQQASRHPVTQRAPAAQVRRLRLTARCLDLRPVFTNDWPLTAKMFDPRGARVETWTW